MTKSTLNVAGRSFDFGNVNFAVLHECEHRRRGLLPDQLEPALMEIARQKLAEIRVSYVEACGSASYWTALEQEILSTTMPQYIAEAREKNRLEKNNYDLWRGGDLVSRAVFALVALTIGGIIIALPFIPIFEDAFAFFLALTAWFYPELKRLMFEHRHSRALNSMIVEAEAYQHDHRIHYLSDEALEEVFRDPELPGLLEESAQSSAANDNVRSIAARKPESQKQ
jgi:hypothetical protein